jgi:hypothetical protein
MTVYRFAMWLAIGASSLAGCRACSTCYDYAPPVADCACGTCGHGRAGSAFAGGGVVENGGEVIYEEGQSQDNGVTPTPAN